MRLALRDRLMPLHDRLDRHVAANWDTGEVPLERVLRLHGRVLPGIVAALEAAGVADRYPGWDGPARLAALRDDLRALELPSPGEPDDAAPACAGHDARPAPASMPAGRQDRPRFTPQEVPGALYVLEGARLGNRAMLNRIRAAGEARALASTRFLSCGIEGGAWPRFLAWLEAQPAGPEAVEAAVGGGEAVFRAYLAEAEAATVAGLAG